MSYVITDDYINNDIASAIRDTKASDSLLSTNEFVLGVNDIQLPNADLANVTMSEYTFNFTQYTALIDEIPPIRNIPLQDNRGELYLTIINGTEILPFNIEHTLVSFIVGLKSGKSCKMKVGYYDNSSFIALNDTEYTINHNKQVVWESTYPGDLFKFLVLYIYTDEGDDINFFQFVSNKIGDGYMYRNLNPVIERYGHVYDYGATGSGWGTAFLLRDKVNRQVLGNNSMYQLWMDCYSLIDLDVSEWDTSRWNNGTLCETWSGCLSLRELDLSNWDVSNWSMHATNTLASTFNRCYNLREIKFGNWNTKRWKITSLSTMFNQCYSLRELDLSGWDTSNWVVNSLSSTWNECPSLKLLDISTWDTSGWSVTQLNNAWRHCDSLKELDLTGWNTTNWCVTVLNSIWAYDYCLTELDLSTWDVSNWAVTKLDNAWYECNSLSCLKLGTWDTSNWKVNSLSATWHNCSSLKELNVSDWNTSNWEVTTLNAMFDNCFALRSLDFSKWDTSKWCVTTLNSTWSNCMSLKNLGISTWDTSGWAIASMYYTWNGCKSLRSLDLSGWVTSNWVVNDLRSTWSSCYSLRHLPVHNWDTSKWVIPPSFMASTLQNCLSLKEFPFTNWDTTNWDVTNILNTFKDLWLETIDISFFKFNSIVTSFLSTSQGSSYVSFGSTIYGVTSGFICGSHNYNKYLPDTDVVYINERYLNREALIELFKFLAPTERVKEIHFLAQPEELTEADIKIATDKGYRITGVTASLSDMSLNSLIDDPIEETI